MELSTCDSLTKIPADSWNELAGDTNPFIQHDFLLALEQHSCLHPYGWHPMFLLIKEGEKLLGAAPAYIKTNSYGEFVFDWSWADAYQQAGKPYYPKMVIAIPFTPANTAKFLVHPDADTQLIIGKLTEFSLYVAKEYKLSSIHNLFISEDITKQQTQSGFFQRIDCQFHWKNNHYTDFDHFLSALKPKKRKNIRQERRKVMNSSIKIQRINGTDLTDDQWLKLYDFYRITFMKKSGSPTLTLEFFKAIKHKILAIIAATSDEMVAGAICIIGKETLYGRHWGCFEDYDGLHFEACYYQGIEYCIEHKLSGFEPGAQGEHKISRGFLPTITWSSHWVADEQFRQIITTHCARERQYMQQHYQELLEKTPYSIVNQA
ncbi:MAG: GNAT family N-acetyltransferase [Gammaproteobacteria bacterium]|nr:GNAT family N-acetyltransferase [Gammaproteobacteria bacterium]